MKKIFVLLLLCCCSFGFANAPVFFEEIKEEPAVPAISGFKLQEPVFVPDEPDPNCTCPRIPLNEIPHKNRFQVAQDELPKTQDCCDDEKCEELSMPHAEVQDGEKTNARMSKPHESNCLTWRRFSANFGAETIYLRFPRSPAVSQTADTYTAYATDWGVSYSVTAYYPPISHIDAHAWFHQILSSKQMYPFELVAHSIFQESSDVWVMDYIVYDCVKDYTLKHRTVVTPFNGYTVQCVKPYGTSDEFDYFVDNFFIRVE